MTAIATNPSVPSTVPDITGRMSSTMMGTTSFPTAEQFLMDVTRHGIQQQGLTPSIAVPATESWVSFQPTPMGITKNEDLQTREKQLREQSEQQQREQQQREQRQREQQQREQQQREQQQREQQQREVQQKEQLRAKSDESSEEEDEFTKRLRLQREAKGLTKQSSGSHTPQLHQKTRDQEQREQQQREQQQLEQQQREQQQREQQQREQQQREQQQREQQQREQQQREQILEKQGSGPIKKVSTKSDSSSDDEEDDFTKNLRLQREKANQNRGGRGGTNNAQRGGAVGRGGQGATRGGGLNSMLSSSEGAPAPAVRVAKKDSSDDSEPDVVPAILPAPSPRYTLTGKPKPKSNATAALAASPKGQKAPSELSFLSHRSDGTGGSEGGSSVYDPFQSNKSNSLTRSVEELVLAYKAQQNTAAQPLAPQLSELLQSHSKDPRGDAFRTEVSEALRASGTSGDDAIISSLEKVLDRHKSGVRGGAGTGTDSPTLSSIKKAPPKRPLSTFTK
jgi:chemotaxis protein histidine kinase CheA